MVVACQLAALPPGRVLILAIVLVFVALWLIEALGDPRKRR